MPPDFLNPTLDLFESIPHTVVLDPGAKLLCGFAVARGVELLAVIADIVSISPFRHMRTPGGRMSVAMTNCGAAGWVTDRTGYRYDSIDPETRDRWPAMPQSFAALAQVPRVAFQRRAGRVVVCLRRPAYPPIHRLVRRESLPLGL